MNIFTCFFNDHHCCHLLKLLFFLIHFLTTAFCKCTLDKQDIRCFGSTWKQDLLPIENNSLEKLYISKCTESTAQSKTVDIDFLRNVSKLVLLSITNCALIRPPIVNYQINSVEIIDLSNNIIDTNAQFPILGLDFFKRFPNLRILNLTNNKLTHLPTNWFDCPSQLEIIILDDNLIAGLNPSLASCFVKLKHMSLKGNTFERLRMPMESRKFFNGPYIKDAAGLKLFADQNNMIDQDNKKSGYYDEKISRGRHDYLGVFPKFKALEILDLSHNNIKSIDQIPLSYLENLNKLNISYNRLSIDVMSGNHEIGCDFGTAPFYINGKSGITDLDLSGNSGLTKVHSCWTYGLHNLQYLGISNCSISSIYDLSFDKMKALTMLDLSYNKLSNVPKEIAVVAKSLIWLNIAHNNISQITSSVLSSLENLQNLNISHNLFESLMTFPISGSDNKLSDSISDFSTFNRDSNPEESTHLLAKMKHLKYLDLSFNGFRKVSAVSDLSSSMKSDGELEIIDVRGNPFITQFIDFNPDSITTSVKEFLIDENLKLFCDCNLLGFVKWIIRRSLKVSVRCVSPEHLFHVPVTDPVLIALILGNNSCSEVSNSPSTKAIYRLKLSYNANVTADSSQSDNDPMDDGQKKTTNQKRQIEFQKWVMLGNNLTLRCEFICVHPIQVPIVVEWQRIKVRPIDNSYYGEQDSHQSLNIFLKNEKSEQFNSIKYGEKIEQLRTTYDPRVKIGQIGPVSENVVVDSWMNIEQSRKVPFLHTGSRYKYVGFLILKPIFLSDIGRYRCSVTGLPGSYGQSPLISKEESIKVFAPPRFTTTPSNLIAILEGDTIEITCRAVGNPTPMTALSRIGTKDFPAAKGRRMRIYKDDSSFFITSVRQVDTGNYSCTSRNVAGIISYNFTIKVQMPATILNKNQPRKTIRIGEPLIIDFKVTGIPLPGVKWFKDNQRILENDRIRFSADQLMLVIQSALTTDAGLYKISILNALGGNDAFVSVAIIDSLSHFNNDPISNLKEKIHEKDGTMIPDYWLGGIIITVILSILLTSILWITIFFCFTKVMGSKKRRLLLISKSKSRDSFDKPVNTTTFSFSGNCVPSVFKPLHNCSIPLSLTTSTLVPHEFSQEQNEVHKTKAPSDFYSSQVFDNNCLPYSNQTRNNNHVSSLFSATDQSSNKITDPCDSGIDSSQVYSETLNSADIPLPLLYHTNHNSQHHHQGQPHKTKHRTNHQKQRKRYNCSTSSDSSETLKASRPKNHRDTHTNASDIDEMDNYLVQVT